MYTKIKCTLGNEIFKGMYTSSLEFPTLVDKNSPTQISPLGNAKILP
jgi:hypothetical protein